MEEQDSLDYQSADSVANQSFDSLANRSLDSVAGSTSVRDRSDLKSPVPSADDIAGVPIVMGMTTDEAVEAADAYRGSNIAWTWKELEGKTKAIPFIARQAFVHRLSKYLLGEMDTIQNNDGESNSILGRGDASLADIQSGKEASLDNAKSGQQRRMPFPPPILSRLDVAAGGASSSHVGGKEATSLRSFEEKTLMDDNIDADGMQTGSSGSSNSMNAGHRVLPTSSFSSNSMNAGHRVLPTSSFSSNSMNAGHRVLPTSSLSNNGINPNNEDKAKSQSEKAMDWMRRRLEPRRQELVKKFPTSTAGKYSRKHQELFKSFHKWGVMLNMSRFKDAIVPDGGSIRGWPKTSDGSHLLSEPMRNIITKCLESMPEERWKKYREVRHDKQETDESVIALHQRNMNKIARMDATLTQLATLYYCQEFKLTADDEAKQGILIFEVWS